MKTYFYSVYLFSILTLIGCQKVKERPNSTNTLLNSVWSIPKLEVTDGGPGKDGIPELTDPEMIPISAVGNYLHTDDLVLGYANGTDIRAYAIPILDWHEIINDQIGNQAIAITYCPLTGTGIGWDRTINGEITTFGVSGLLYNSNLIPYDRLTNSNWSQMLLKSVNGAKINEKIKTYNLFETTLETWKAMFPNSLITTDNTAYDRNYQFYPYGQYRVLDDLFLFPVSSLDSRIPNKERVLGIIINDESKVYQFESFSADISIIEDNLNGINLIAIGSTDYNFMVVYKRILSGTTLSFTALQNSFPSIMIDHEGTQWDALGRGINGPRMGEQLETVTQFMGYWFAWSVFYPEILIYEN